MNPPLPVLDLRSATSDEINAAVAEHVARWTNVFLSGSGQCGDEIVMCGLDPRFPELGRREVPDYLTDLNVVIALLWLSGRYWRAENSNGWCRVTLDSGSGYAPTFCRAAVIALLRASGKLTIIEDTP